MSETPETDAAKFETLYGDDNDGYSWREAVPAEVCRKLERERDKERKVSEKRRTLLIYFMEAVGKVESERDEQTAQMCQDIGYLSTIAEDCEAWLNNQCDETACEFIKAVRDYARKAVNNE